MPINIATCDDTEEDMALLSEALYAYDGSFHVICYTDGQALLDESRERKDSIDPKRAAIPILGDSWTNNPKKRNTAQSPFTAKISRQIPYWDIIPLRPEKPESRSNAPAAFLIICPSGKPIYASYSEMPWKTP